MNINHSFAPLRFTLIAIPVILLLGGGLSCRERKSASDAPAPNTAYKSPFEFLPEPGVETLTSIESLPLIDMHSRTLQTSSHDLTGGNRDGFKRGTHFYKDAHGDYVVFDDFGPGCVYRTWFTGFTSWLGKINIYVDNLDVPIVNRRFLRFFHGFNELFSFPRVYFFNKTSGGFCSYVPICYKKRCRISLSMKPEFFNITYRHYSADTMLQSFNPDENIDLWNRQWSTQNLGKDPKSIKATREYRGSVVIAPGAAEDLLTIEGAGAIWSLRLRAQPFEQEALSRLRIKAWWDNQENPSIDAPFLEFFGTYFLADAPKSLMIGLDKKNFYCYFPMPFWSHARIAMENSGGSAVEIESDIATSLTPMRKAYGRLAGYFNAQLAHQNPTIIQKDFIAVDTEGAGRFVGITHTMQSPHGHDYMEGDERIYVNGSGSPALYGTGTEDYYNGGWYYIWGTFAQALHGAPTHYSKPGEDTAVSYRIHLGDSIPFMRGFRFGIEHDRQNNITGDDYRAVTYFYRNPRIRALLTDTLDIGDAQSEKFHEYNDHKAYDTHPLLSYYEGDNDDVPVTDRGRIVADLCSFTMSIDPNNAGVFLRRRFDQVNGRQTARVLVDNAVAGAWYNLAHNSFKRFADSDFLIPAPLTKGKSSITVSLQNTGPTPWTQFRFEAYSVVMDDHSQDVATLTPE